MDILEIVSLTLWWGEGTKSRRDVRWKSAVTYPIEITNTNPLIHKIFLEYLSLHTNVEKSRIHVQLQIHENDNIDELEKYWRDELGIPKERFQKTIIRKIGNKPGKTMGTCKVRFADKSTYIMLQSKLEDLQDLIDL